MAWDYWEGVSNPHSRSSVPSWRRTHAEYPTAHWLRRLLRRPFHTGSPSSMDSPAAGSAGLPALWLCAAVERAFPNAQKFPCLACCGNRSRNRLAQTATSARECGKSAESYARLQECGFVPYPPGTREATV